MGLFDGFRKKPEEQGAGQKAEGQESSASSSSEARFDQPCAVCGKAPTDVKWMGQYWHKKCKRSGKRYARKMI